ncbi:hypothetical protein ABTX15_32850 [Micromonospora sp. NPDC094482]|uniref:hypothetical protein n=1 Tax=Micromonospora sp. NPDC094482 TaxID=3155081 RepID=UPI00331FB3FA
MTNFTAAAAAITLGLLSFANPASAASSVASKKDFDQSRRCDANVTVSDVTTYGKVEVYGGFVCPTGSGLFNEPVRATITIQIYRNGVSILRSQKELAFGTRPLTLSSDFYAITYPDYSSSDRFKGWMQISSLSGSVTLTTGEITT